MIEMPSSDRKFQHIKGSEKSPARNRNSNSENPLPSIYMTPSPNRTLVQCCIERTQESALSPTVSVRYTFKYQVHKGKEITVMVAEKQLGSKYYIFDCSRIGFDVVGEMKFNKKAGNYIGKLKKDPQDRALYILHDANVDSQELVAISYDVPSLITQWRNGQPPRKIQVVVNECKERDVSNTQQSIKTKMKATLKTRVSTESDLHLLRSKEPIYEGGQYRLNFGGRVSVASVKNMQIVDGLHDLVFQFGKVGHDKFHLDYK